MDYKRWLVVILVADEAEANEYLESISPFMVDSFTSKLTSRVSAVTHLWTSLFTATDVVLEMPYAVSLTQWPNETPAYADGVFEGLGLKRVYPDPPGGS
tara:strand:+ start:643 stop:939 length:297 start_codon:yes stop_codon:yes gene_type:complete